MEMQPALLIPAVNSVLKYSAYGARLVEGSCRVLFQVRLKAAF